MLRHLILAITNLGDPVLLITAAAVLIAYMLRCGARRTALLWLQSFAVALVLVALSKFALQLLGHAVLEVSSPSGHTGVSAAFYLCTAIALSRAITRGGRIALVGASAALVLAIAISRVVLGAHDVAEIVIGLLIGVGAALWFARRSAGQIPLPAFRARHFAAFAALVVALNGWHVDPEPGIHQIAAGHWPPPPHVVSNGYDSWLVF
jgi:membrane-associated phospholipid phosphatase